MIIAIVGPSGSGKSTLSRALDCFYRSKAIGGIPYGYDQNIVDAVKKCLNKQVKPIGDKLVVREAISHTTRPPRTGERDGVHYYFVTENEFLRLSRYESTIYNGYYYGLSEESVKETLKFSELAIVVVDQHGVSNIRNKGADVTSVFLKSDIETMKKRMIARGDGLDMVDKRINNALVNLELDYPEADFVVDNCGDLANSLSQMIEIVETLR